MIGAGKRDASTVDERVFSRMMVARGLGSPRSDQLAALEKVGLPFIQRVQMICVAVLHFVSR